MMIDNIIQGPRYDYPFDASLSSLISRQARREPERIALSVDATRLSYGQLERRSNQLARRLQGLGAGPGVLVAVCVERSPQMLISLLAVLKTGAGYVPIDPTYPRGRVAYMLDDCEARVILTQTALRPWPQSDGAAVVSVDDDDGEIAAYSDAELASAPGPDDVAYVIYTSGSTGKPKGVEVPHRALVNFMTSLAVEPGLGRDDRLLAVTTLSFDIAGLELYLPLTVGAEVVLASRALASDGAALGRRIDEAGITVMQATPATWRLLLDSGWQGSRALRVFCGGETLPRELARRLGACTAELWNLYGPTEATIWSTLYRVVDGPGAVPIGRPIANTDILILDDRLEPVDDGQVGELFIGGHGLARGYYKRPALTAARFVAHPLDARRRLYRTGDLARRRDDGELEHLGRVDFQVKVRGFRIELGEIEAALETHDAVRQAVVMAREDSPGDKRLVAYLRVAGGGPGARELRALLAQTLPDYMVPGGFVFVDAMPLTPNGKVDRNALPAPGGDRPDLPTAYRAPRDRRERRLAAIWTEVLRVDAVGVDDDFFELGGDSLKVAQVATRVREDFDIEMPLRAMFDNPTIAAIAPLLGTGDAAQPSFDEFPIADVVRADPIPLSFAQNRVWFIHQCNPDNLAYNFQAFIRFRGALDVAALERALDEILRRHEAYRTSFPTVDGGPVQVVHPHRPYELPQVDLSALPLAECEAAVKSWCDEEFQRRFDLARLPLVRWTLLKYAADDHCLVHREHHLVHDGWAFNVFLRELVDIYRAYHAGEPSPLPELPVQFAEFATWQRRWMSGALSDHQLAYWKNKFATVPPVLPLPTRGPRPAAQTFRGTSLRPEIAPSVCAGLRELARREGSTLFMTMLAGFIALLHRYTGEQDIAVGTFFANRRGREAERLIGMILNNVVIRTSLQTDPSVSELIRQVRDVVLEDARYQDVPFDRVVDAVQPVRDMSYNPLFQVMFSFHDEPMPERTPDGLDVRVTPVLSNGSSKFDLGVIGIPHSAQKLGLEAGSAADGLTMIWEHNTDLFDTATIARMIEHYKTLLGDMIAQPGKRLSELSLDEPRQRARALRERNDTARNYPGERGVHQLIADQAARTPDAVAVVADGRSLSYAQLDARANQVAHRLRAVGVERNALVGLSVERSERMLVGLLGILKAGGAYVPIDPTFPDDRRRFMLEDASIRWLLTESTLDGAPRVDALTAVCLDDAAVAEQPSEPPPEAGVGGDDLAYVIYTSGSTGRPKGVQVPHRALVNFLYAMRDAPGIGADDRLLAVTTLSFDIAGLELFLPLTVGARTVVGSRQAVTDGTLLARALDESAATVMQATPSTWQLLIDAGWDGRAGFTALCGGEPLPRPLAEQLLRRVDALWNMYGPTETTIWSTLHRVGSAAGAVPIGRPIGNTQVYLLDRSRRPVPDGAVGELAIGGAGLASGYLGRPRLTAERFIDNPIADAPSPRLYLTGDLARYLPDGTLECLGRTDDQIKLRGFRIELGEIEAILAEHPAVSRAVAAVREDVAGDRRLVAYVTAAEGATVAPAELLAEARKRLAEYMAPSSCVIMDALPLTPNGKVDRKALPPPPERRSDDAAGFVAPRTDVERTLAQVWSELLGVSPIGVYDNFFHLGGHSLLATRMVTRINDLLSVDVGVYQLFLNPTIDRFGIAVAQSQAGAVDAASVAALLDEITGKA